MNHFLQPQHIEQKIHFERVHLHLILWKIQSSFLENQLWQHNSPRSDINYTYQSQYSTDDIAVSILIHFFSLHKSEPMFEYMEKSNLSALNDLDHIKQNVVYD